MTPIRRALRGALVGVVLLGSARPALAQKLEALWYSVDGARSVQSFLDHANQISIVSPQVFAFDRNGNIHGKVDPRMVARAHEAGVKLVPLVMNPGFDQPIVHRILTQSSARARAVKSLVALCRDQHFDGIQFDLENIDVADRAAFTEFSRLSADALHAVHCSLSAAVVPRSGDEPGPSAYDKWIFKNWRGVYDYKALADVMDFISFMTYAQHTGGTTPGPVAGYSWMESCLKYVLSLGVPPEKISLGIPSYSDWWYAGYDKKGGAHARGSDIGYPKADSLLSANGAHSVWDEREKAAYAYWPKSDVYQWMWIEDARAFVAKLDLVRQYRLRGYSVWVLGLEDPAVWGRVGEVSR